MSAKGFNLEQMIPIVFRDNDILVVDKPIGISIHNLEDPVNLIQLLEQQLRAKDSDENSRFPQLFPVHRLDKETSGIQIFARTEKAASRLAIEFQSRTVAKRYIGVLRGALKSDSGTWTNPISDKSEGRVNPAGMARDRIEAETRFQVVNRNKFFTECEFDLVTGRQHQIRKHAALNGHALVGDARYGDKKYNQRMADMYSEARMFLHCTSVELLGQKYECSRPDAFGLLVV